MTVTLIILVAYVIATLIVGIWSTKYANTARAFEGVNLGLWFVVAAGAGEWMGGTSTTGVSEYGFLYGISGAWYTIANAIGICILAIFFARMFRRLNKRTVPGIIGAYIGERAQKVSGALLIFVMAAVGISQMIAIGTLGETLFGLKPAASIAILGFCVLLYTVFGGMVAVGYTNVIHMVVMYVGMVIALALAFSEIGGLSGMNDSLPDSYFSMTSIGVPKVLSWIVASVLGACTAQAGLQPVLAAKDEKTAQTSSYLIALLVAPFGILTALLGMIAKVKYPELENAKNALPTLLVGLNPVVGGVMMAALLAAILSTASPIFLSCGTLFARDIFCNGKTEGKMDERKILRVQRLATFITGAVCIIMAIIMCGTSTVLDIVYFAYSLRGSLFIILLFGIYCKKTSQRSAVCAMVITGLVGLFWVTYKSFTETYPICAEFSETYAAVIAATGSMIIGILAERKRSKSRSC